MSVKCPHCNGTGKIWPAILDSVTAVIVGIATGGIGLLPRMKDRANARDCPICGGSGCVPDAPVARPVEETPRECEHNWRVRNEYRIGGDTVLLLECTRCYEQRRDPPL